MEFLKPSLPPTPSIDDDFDSYFGSNKTGLTTISPQLKDESDPATLYDSPEQSNAVRVEYGDHLRAKFLVVLDETEVNQKFGSCKDGIPLPSYAVNIDQIQTSATNLTDYKITDFSSVRHLCNGSHSNIFKGM